MLETKVNADDICHCSSRRHVYKKDLKVKSDSREGCQNTLPRPFQSYCRLYTIIIIVIHLLADQMDSVKLW